MQAVIASSLFYCYLLWHVVSVYVQNIRIKDWDVHVCRFRKPFNTITWYRILQLFTTLILAWTNRMHDPILIPGIACLLGRATLVRFCIWLCSQVPGQSSAQNALCACIPQKAIGGYAHTSFNAWLGLAHLPLCVSWSMTPPLDADALCVVLPS